MAVQEIEGLKVKFRDLGEDEIVYNADNPIELQMFFKTTHPFSVDDLVAIANKEHTYTEEQKKWLDRENKRMDRDGGIYVMIKGRLTFIPPSYYGYLNYWTLEDGSEIEYRESDRKFFLFFEYCLFHPYILAITRGKGRRKGATSQGVYLVWWICGRAADKIGGMVSYNDTSIDKIFKMLFLRGFKNLLPCFVEDYDSNSETYIRFRKVVEKKKKGVPVPTEGLNSYIDFQPTTINSYDSGRLSFLLGDEFGKWEKVNVNTYFGKVKACMLKGKKKVGFAYIPTTVNPKKKGGENYRKFWDNANQYAINPETGQPYGEYTPSRVVRYFDPAYEGYAGCIDQYGDSVIDDPKEPIMGNDGEWITKGAISEIKSGWKGLTEEELMDYRRDWPLDLYDFFAFETGVCEFNAARIRFNLDKLNEDPVYLRKIRLVETQKKIVSPIDKQKEKIERKINWMDDESAGWLLLEEPHEKNKFEDINGTIVPKNYDKYCIGVDTYRIGFAEDGSKGTICVFKKSCVINGEETGCYPVALYVGRPRIIQHLYDEVIKACMYWGCKVNFEISAGDFFYGYFFEKQCYDLLYWTPARDPHKRKQAIKPGTESASPFELAAQLEAAKIFFDGDNQMTYNGNTERVKFPTLLKQALDYNHSERTPYDEMIALMMALLPALKSYDTPPIDSKPKVLLQTYKWTYDQAA